MEELTLRLGLEKRGRVNTHYLKENICSCCAWWKLRFELVLHIIQEDLEKSKEQEIAKLQEALHEMHLQVEEANSLVSKEKEASKKAIEEAAPVIQETPVIVEDTEKIDSLIAEIENLKVIKIPIYSRWWWSKLIKHHIFFI